MSNFEPMTPTSSELRTSDWNGERRSSTRYALRGEARCTGYLHNGQAIEITGVTRDVSKTGAFIEASVLPAVDTSLTVEVVLRGGSGDAMEARLCGTGIVRHVQSDSRQPAGFGVAAPFRTEGPAAP